MLVQPQGKGSECKSGKCPAHRYYTPDEELMLTVLVSYRNNNFKGWWPRLLWYLTGPSLRDESGFKTSPKNIGTVR